MKRLTCSPGISVGLPCAALRVPAVARMLAGCTQKAVTEAAGPLHAWWRCKGERRTWTSAGGGVEVGTATAWSRNADQGAIEQAGGGSGASQGSSAQEANGASQLLPGDQTRSDASSYVPKSIRLRHRRCP